MKRRSFLLAVPATAFPIRAGLAQDADAIPPDAPGATARDDARFSAELLESMRRGEDLVRERLPAAQGLRVVRRQVARSGWGAVEMHYMQQLAVGRRWRDAGITRPQGSSFGFLPPQGWTNGKLVFALVGAHPTRAENGLLPFSIITNMRDG